MSLDEPVLDPRGFRDRQDHILARVAAACERAGRSPDEVTLIGVSKGQPLERLQEAFAGGLRVFGENRVQEALGKAAQLSSDIEWHLIGPLQSNKAKRAVELFSCIHSVDRLKIARVLHREALTRQRRLPCFLEINLDEEESKHGFTAKGVVEVVEELAAFDGLDIRGLMAIPPRTPDPDAARGWFRQLRTLREELAAGPAGEHIGPELSMGMSGDFELAIEEGATHIRVGTALFGPRPKPA